MIILVSDTSILIDLERGELLEPAFSCGLAMVVPDLLFEKELENYNGAYLRSLGLGVVALTPDELSLAQAIHSQRTALSLPDCFALSCATRPGHALVSGDRILRGEAKARAVAVYGLLWVLDSAARASYSGGTAPFFHGPVDSRSMRLRPRWITTKRCIFSRETHSTTENASFRCASDDPVPGSCRPARRGLPSSG